MIKSYHRDLISLPWRLGSVNNSCDTLKNLVSKQNVLAETYQKSDYKRMPTCKGMRCFFFKGRLFL